MGGAPSAAVAKAAADATHLAVVANLVQVDSPACSDCANAMAGHGTKYCCGSSKIVFAPPLVTTSAAGTLPVLPTATTAFGDPQNGDLSVGYRGDMGIT